MAGESALHQGEIFISYRRDDDPALASGGDGDTIKLWDVSPYFAAK